MSRQAQVGVFALLAMLLLFGVFYVITDFGTRHTGYQIGVHFDSASGLPSGALVYFSGVTVGTVDSIDLLPDNTVDVILAINRDVNIPRASKFLIQAPLTGSPSLTIVPPKPPHLPAGVPTPVPTPAAVWAHRVLPVADQPQGTDSATVADLLQEGQGEIRKLDQMLSVLQDREPRMLATLQNTLDNANELTQTANQTVVALSEQARQIGNTLAQTMNSLDDTVGRNSAKIDTLLGSLDATAVALNQSVDSLRSLATDKRLKQNVVDTTQNIADLTQTLASLAGDLRKVTGNTQTQAQIRDTVAQIDAASQKANSLLATLGGTSHVPGVDAGATPYPVPSGSPAAGSATASSPASTAKLKRGLGSILQNLYQIQIRASELSKQRVPSTTPLLGSDRGPQTDVNLLLLPKGTTTFMVGANDIGARTTYNVAALQHLSPSLRIGGGVLYSRLGVLAQYDTGRFGLEGRAYDLRRPTLDLYGNLNVVQWAKLFLGQRDVTRPDRRTVFGIQLQF